MRRIAVLVLVGLAATGLVATGAGADDTRSYRIEMLNAFGIFKGSDVRIAGVRAGTVTAVDINEDKRAEATIELSGPLATLGDRTICRTEPQSLIAEFFIDCTPRGEPMAEGTTIPAERVEQSIQSDLLFNTFREDYRERARVIVNELGTAMAANSENLNEAIRLSVPALADFREVTRIFSRQRRAIERLNVSAERVIGRLAGRRDDVAATIVEGRDAAEITASRRGDLSADVDALDDFLGELRPTLAELGETARDGTPVLANLRAAAPGLDDLSARLPAFNAASTDAVIALGDAAGPGRRALAHGREEIADLARAGRALPVTAEILGDFTADLDDPRRIVEYDERAERACDDPTRGCWSTGREGPTGYTGLEALLNYVYYQSGAINQFDSVGHFLHFNVFDVGGGPCGMFNARPDVPARGGGRTTEITEADPCVSWIGERQPDINFDLGLPRYDNSVCPDGSTHPEICDPSVSTHESGGRLPDSGRRSILAPGLPGDPAAPGPQRPPNVVAPEPPPLGGRPGEEAADELEDLLDSAKPPSPEAAQELLDFLYG